MKTALINSITLLLLVVSFAAHLFWDTWRHHDAEVNAAAAAVPHGVWIWNAELKAQPDLGKGWHRFSVLVKGTEDGAIDRFVTRFQACVLEGDDSAPTNPPAEKL